MEPHGFSFFTAVKISTTHNMVYDCGVSIRHEWPMSHVVRQAYTGSKRNEILNGIYS